MRPRIEKKSLLEKLKKKFVPIPKFLANLGTLKGFIKQKRQEKTAIKFFRQNSSCTTQNRPLASALLSWQYRDVVSS